MIKELYRLELVCSLTVCNTFEMLDIGIFWKSCVDIVIVLSPGLHLHELKSKESLPNFQNIF